jgi:hypothetical protein
MKMASGSVMKISINNGVIMKIMSMAAESAIIGAAKALFENGGVASSIMAS